MPTLISSQAMGGATAAAASRALWLCCLFALATVTRAQFQCSSCPAAGLCCDCCVGGVLTLAVCNDADHYACWPTLTPTSSLTSTAAVTTTPVPTSTMTSTAQVPRLPFRGTSAVFTQTPKDVDCQYAYWTVPAGVTNITLRMWGAGGAAGEQGSPGGGGAYVEGVAFTTPGEVLRITIGSGSGAMQPFRPNRVDPACGGGAACGIYFLTGGGASVVERIQSTSGLVVFPPVAVAGGGASGTFKMNSLPATGTIAEWCTNPPSAAESCGGGGFCGGMWTAGGNAGGTVSGGTSYAGTLLQATVLAPLPETPWVSQNQNSIFYRSGTGMGLPWWNEWAPSGDGLVAIEWDGPNPSPTRTPTRTVPATPSRTVSPTASLSSSGTPGATRTTSATATKSAYCLPNSFVAYAHRDLNGAWVGSTLVPSIAACQTACCEAPACDGFAVDVSLLGIAGQTNCYLLVNVTGLIPSSGFHAGVRAGPL